MYDAYERVHGQISGTPIGYKAELETIATLRPYVDRFFDAVMVNAPDPTVRGNRLAFLLLLSKTFSTIADFSEIVTARRKIDLKMIVAPLTSWSRLSNSTPTELRPKERP